MTVPVETPVTIPVLLIVAFVSSDEVHAPVVAGVPDPVKEIVFPIHTLLAPVIVGWVQFAIEQVSVTGHPFPFVPKLGVIVKTTEFPLLKLFTVKVVIPVAVLPVTAAPPFIL